MSDRLQTHRQRVGLPGQPDQSPPAPATAYGEWKGGWVDFDGVKLQVGASRGDPGPFVNGNGPELAEGIHCPSATTAAAPAKPGCSA
ncbi:hypothetical protein NIIDMKKI_31340 [Mycobacterium kansasii]|uniref:Uncharacterized protein n=1 Tax=Mycobacterium kansasii TaxID=1768 RepID=A0A7G1IH81_MYCKA|nr:hypothetical protein NIIDMKKI_31340 [Mycobacterium kansasii]